MAIATSGARGSATGAIAYFCALLCGFAAQQRAKEGILGRLRRPKPHLKRDVATAMSGAISCRNSQRTKHPNNKLTS
jgi:hypothetical protein